MRIRVWNFCFFFQKKFYIKFRIEKSRTKRILSIWYADKLNSNDSFLVFLGKRRGHGRISTSGVQFKHREKRCIPFKLSIRKVSFDYDAERKEGQASEERRLDDNDGKKGREKREKILQKRHI